MRFKPLVACCMEYLWTAKKNKLSQSFLSKLGFFTKQESHLRKKMNPNPPPKK